MPEKKKEFDVLSPIPYGEKPKILLVGNGINLSFKNAIDTDRIIQSEWKKNYITDLPKRDNNNPQGLWKLPFPMQVVVATKDHVQSCMSELAEIFKTSVVVPEKKIFITELIDSGFDAVLTTNYSLEFEKSILEKYSESKVYKCYRTTNEQTNQQKIFGIFQCTELPDKNHTLLWHIHGTALRKKSLVMGQLYYGKLLSEISARATNVNKYYKAAIEKQIPFQPKSWIDYFLIADVHILGFRLDFSESDIWWLLSYKKSAFPDSKVYFYDRFIDEEKQLLFNCYDIKTPTIFFDENEGEQMYINYYKRVCADINH